MKSVLYKAVLFCMAFLPESYLSAQDKFVVLGDMHLDKFDFHDMDYVYTRPSDWKQITKEYPYFTAAFMPKLMSAVSDRVNEGCGVVIQLGDLMEGVAGNDSLSLAMAEYSIGVLDNAAGDAVVLPVKGNHDVSASPGQPEAWKSTVLPYVERQTGLKLEHAMYRYSYGENVDFFVAEQFFSPDEMLPETALLEFLKTELPESTAKYKFLLTHQPVIPVTDRCWHLFSGIRRDIEDGSIREEFLDLLAEYRVTVLCAHLHKYSKCVRETPKGNIVQLMMVSTVNSFEHDTEMPEEQMYWTKETMDRKWQPHTLSVREKIIEQERPHVKYFTSGFIPGYAVIEIKENGAEFSFYPGYSSEPSETFFIDDLYE